MNIFLLLISLFRHPKPTALVCCHEQCWPMAHAERIVKLYPQCWVEPLREKRLIVRQP